MQFFTLDWWQSGSPDADDVFARYATHFSEIRSRLPSDIVALQDRYTLHDAEVKEVVCDLRAHAVTIKLEGWNPHLDAGSLYTLTFIDATSFEQIFLQQEFAETKMGALGYWECSLEHDLIRVNMLFSSGAEFKIAFKRFRLEVLPHEAQGDAFQP